MERNEIDLTTDLYTERRKHERLFCGCAFINPQAALERCAWLEPGDFLDKDMGEFWRGIKEHGDPMRAASEAHLLLDITVASTEIPTSLYPESYAEELKRLGYLAEITGSLSEIARAVGERDENFIRNKVAKLHTLSRAGSGLNNINLPDSMNQEFTQLITAQTPSLLTGLEDLDAILGGLFIGELTIVAGRPGVGKTSIASAIAQNIATLNKGSKILFFSLEMDKLQLWARMACAKTNYSWREIRSGRASAQAVQAVQAASDLLRMELQDRFIVVDDVWDVPTIVSICAQVKPDLVVLDHLGEIRWKDDSVEEVNWYGKATKILRTEISRRMHIPVILLHQLNREVEKRDNKVPHLSDLKWSGDLEQTADIVIMLYREDYYDDEATSPNIVPMEIWIRKNRQGVMNACAVMNFDKRSQRFSPARAVPSSTNTSSNNISAGKPMSGKSSANPAKQRIPIVDRTPQVWYDKDND